MQARILVLLLSVFFIRGICLAQSCTTRGQTPGTAFPICGNKVFEQSTVPICQTHKLTVPRCKNDGTDYIDKNPFWYKFTCYKSGTLGFTITPNDLGDDYDWQLYDITGHDPEEVYTNTSLIVAGNWAGTYGITGAQPGGSSYIECSSLPRDNHNSFAAMPQLVEGHEYLLMVSHFTDTQSGYGLAFDGGTAEIIQIITPQLLDIRSSCDETQVTLRLNKRIQCASLAADGSDFRIGNAPPGVKVTAAIAPDCETEFDADSLILTLNASLPPGDYLLISQKGTDGNTLLDNCDFEMEEGSSLPLTILPKQPTPLDSIVPASCAPQILELVFRKRMRCLTIAADGSDFIISGPHPVKVDAAYGNCGTENLSTSIFLHLSQPITLKGNYKVITKAGIDGNVIIDECGQETPANQSVSFYVKDTVSSQFTASIGYGCESDTIRVMHDGGNDVIGWQWTFDSIIHRTGQTANVIYHTFGEKKISLITTNGFCRDTSEAIVNLDNELKADFLLPNVGCPDEPVIITDTSTGNIISYQWDFGNGKSSDLKSPPAQIYPQAGSNRKYPVTLVVENNLNCRDTLVKQLPLAYTCHITVPTAFTPNGDGINDYLYPVGAYRVTGLLFRVYNRFGQIVFQSRDLTKKWDGTYLGEPQTAGTYVWTLQYISDTKQFVYQRGTSVLIR